MRDFLKLTPWIISVVAVSSAVINTVCANYDVAIWSFIALVGWLNVAITRN